MSIARSLITIIAGAGVVMHLACRAAPPALPSPLRLSLALPDELVLGGDHSHFGLALAPDGRRLVIAASIDPSRHDAERRVASSGHVANPRSEGDRRLYLRDPVGDTWQPLAHTEGGEMPFWSPDGQTLAFYAGGKLRALSFADNTVRDLTDAPSPRGGVWHERGDIIFAPRADGPLMRRTVEGTVSALTTLTSGELSHRFPQLAGRDHVVFFARAQEPTRQGVWIAPIDAPEERRRLVSSEAQGLVTGPHLLYAAGEALVGHAIDLEGLTLSGRSTLLGSRVGRSAEHELFATVGGDVLLYGMPTSSMRELRWVQQDGTSIRQLGEPMNASEVRVAPGGTQVAVARVDPQLRTLDVWVYDEDRPLPRRLSQGIDADDAPAWHPRGDRLVWVSGRRSVIVRDARAAQPEQTLHKFGQPVRTSDWSADGRWIVVTAAGATTGSDIVLLRMAATRAEPPQVSVYADAPFNEHYGTVSPDGRWMAYASDESGAMEIYVDAFPIRGPRARVSVGGGTEPRWLRDDTLLFRRGREIHRAVLTASGSRREAVSSERLFDVGSDIRSFDIGADGQLLLNVAGPRPQDADLGVLIHVRSLLPSAP